MKTVVKVCDGCGGPMKRRRVRDSTYAYNVYCSTSCQYKYQSRVFASAYSKSGPYSEAHACCQCKEIFYPNHPATKYCTTACRLKAQRERVAAAWLGRGVIGDIYDPNHRKAYKLVLMKQQTSCSICKRSFSEMSLQQIHVDHDHRTGKIRGLLCFKCNAGLGQFGDSLELLQSAINYLRAAA